MRGRGATRRKALRASGATRRRSLRCLGRGEASGAKSLPTPSLSPPSPKIRNTALGAPRPWLDMQGTADRRICYWLQDLRKLRRGHPSFLGQARYLQVFRHYFCMPLDAAVQDPPAFERFRTLGWLALGCIAADCLQVPRFFILRSTRVALAFRCAKLRSTLTTFGMPWSIFHVVCTYLD